MSDRPKTTRRKTIKQVQNDLSNKRISCEELVRGHLQEIDEGKDLNVFITVLADRALADAREADTRIAKGDTLNGLEGIVMAVKDNILIKDIRCTAGSKILADYTASYTASGVERLRGAGAIAIGKTNLDEFGMGSSTQMSYFGPTKNPVDPERVPGGSSGGSAAAVRAGMAQFALGTDMGGSCRQPASYCGVYGFKPSYGRISRHGLISSGPSLDQIGILTNSAQDTEAVLEILAGRDAQDATTLREPFMPKTDFELEGLRIGIPKEFFGEGLDPQIKRAIDERIELFEGQGAHVKHIELPNATHAAIAAYYIIMPAESSSNLARFDGIRYGLREQGSDVIDTYLKTRESGFGAEVKRRMLMGTFALSAGYADQYYVRAQKVRTMLRQTFAKAFEDIDVMITPTTPSVAFKAGEKMDDPVKMYLEDIYTVSLNITGLPGISVPCGLADGLPFGMQIIGGFGQEAMILALAKAYDELT